MRNTQVPYQETGYFSNLIIDYLKGKKELNNFYNHSSSIDSFQTIIEGRKNLPINRKVLVNSLKGQYQSINTSPQVESNLELLTQSITFTVTAGHQLNLFTGPLYFIYKIASTINLTKSLKTAYPQFNFVPVFWMATEDHDLEEVNHFNLFQKKFELTTQQKGAVGRIKLEGIDGVLEELKEALGNREAAAKIVNLFSSHYSSNKTYAEATRGLVNELFGKYGLVILDGDDKKLKSEFIPELEKELIQRKSHQQINKLSEQLVELGYKKQINPREINLFYLKEDIRERIVLEGNQFKVLNTSISFTQAEIIEELNNHPERFSPNAVLRPLYQEKILPNLAYIGGGGELAYWFQLKDLFRENKVSFPILMLRNSVLVVDKGSSKRLQKLGVKEEELFQKTDNLIKDYLKRNSDVLLDLKQEEKSIVEIYQEIIQKAGNIDASLQPFIKAELQKSIKSLKNIEGRLIKAEKKKEETSINQIKNLKEKLFPDSSLQERNDNIVSLLLFYGEDIIEELLEKLDPLQKQFLILSD